VSRDRRLTRRVGAPGDEGFIAKASTGEPIGAAWYRLFSEEAHGFGSSMPKRRRSHSPFGRSSVVAELEALCATP
jgi:hypothetical protein